MKDLKVAKLAFFHVWKKLNGLHARARGPVFAPLHKHLDALGKAASHCFHSTIRPVANPTIYPQAFCFPFCEKTEPDSLHGSEDAQVNLTHINAFAP